MKKEPKKIGAPGYEDVILHEGNTDAPSGVIYPSVEGFGNQILLKISLPRNCIVINGDIYLYLKADCDDYVKICGYCALKEKCERNRRDDMMPCELFGDGNDKAHFVKLTPDSTQHESTTPSQEDIDNLLKELKQQSV